MKEQELSQSMVWRHRELEKTLLFLQEWDIALDKELLRKKGICICHLLFQGERLQEGAGTGSERSSGNNQGNEENEKRI